MPRLSQAVLAKSLPCIFEQLRSTQYAVRVQPTSLPSPSTAQSSLSRATLRRAQLELVRVLDYRDKKSRGFGRLGYQQPLYVRDDSDLFYRLQQQSNW